MPAHGRDDPHAFYNYETFVQAVQREDPGEFQAWTAQLTRPTEPWAQLPSQYALAPVPISRLVDTDRYRGDNPQDTLGQAAGLAEYANANFFSEDSTFPSFSSPGHVYPFPASSSVIEEERLVTLPSGEQVRRLYWVKDRDGDRGYLLATVGFLRDYLRQYGLDPSRSATAPGLDDLVYRDYAARLLPRAVGYSAALLDYFFRGRLDVAVRAGALDVVNASAEMLGAGLFRLLHEDETGRRQEIVSWQVEGARPGDALTLAFTPPANPNVYVLVFHGALGQEAGAVVGRVVDALPYVFFEQTGYQTLADEADPTGYELTDPQGGSTSYRGRWPTRVRITGQFRKSASVEIEGVAVAPVQDATVAYDPETQRLTVDFTPVKDQGLYHPLPAALVVDTSVPVVNPQGLDYPYPNRHYYVLPASPQDYFPEPGEGAQRATRIYFPVVFPCCVSWYRQVTPANSVHTTFEYVDFQLNGDFTLYTMEGTHRLVSPAAPRSYYQVDLFPGGQYRRSMLYFAWEAYDSDWGAPGPPPASPGAEVESYYRYFEERGPARLRAVLPRGRVRAAP